MSDTNLIVLEGRVESTDAEPNERVVEMARAILHHAESGRLRGFVLCGEMTDAEVVTIVSGEFRPFTMVGHLEFAQQSVIASNIETPTADDS